MKTLLYGAAAAAMIGAPASAQGYVDPYTQAMIYALGQMYAQQAYPTPNGYVQGGVSNWHSGGRVTGGWGSTYGPNQWSYYNPSFGHGVARDGDCYYTMSGWSNC